MSEFKDFIIKLNLKAEEVIMPYYNKRSYTVDTKLDNSVVTEADRNCEAELRELIKKTYPTHGIIGEEHGNENEDAEYVWVLDPIDGTISFIAGVPLFGVLISLLHKGNPIWGSIYQPVTKELCIGNNEKCFLNDTRVTVDESTTLENSLLLTTSVKNIEKYQNYENYKKLRRLASKQRGWGDCYGYLMVATGRANIMLDPILNFWDIAALVPIIRGAGGAISSWSGKDPLKELNCIATNKLIHKEVIEILNKDI